MLSGLLRDDPARPLVTFYDDATGERVELSVTTFANWVHKTAGLVQDDLDVASGATVLVDLPTHWLGAVWLGAAWTGGWCITTEPTLAGECDLVVCGPEAVDRYAADADARPVVALSLRPLGARFSEPLPTGVTDYGAVVLAQPDSFVAYDPPTGESAAWRDRESALTQEELLAAAAENAVVTPGGRLLTDVNPCTVDGRSSLLSPLLQGGSTIWVANPDADAWQSRYDEERATAMVRAAAPAS